MPLKKIPANTSGIAALIVFIIVSAMAWTYKPAAPTIHEDFFASTNPAQQSLKQVINVSGEIELEKTYKISSLISGIVSDILIKENDQVEKGQLLATIDNGQGDTDIKIKQAKLNELQAKLLYKDANCKRLKQLWQENHLSDDAFELIKSEHAALIHQVKGAQAQLEKSKLQFDHTNITAPTNGTIIKINVVEGKGVAVDLAALFEIAQDLTKMKAVLNIDETDLGNLHEQQKIQLKFDAYPDHIFESVITKISYVPLTKDGVVTFQAEADIDNSEQLLRPGMSTKVAITVAESEDALSISSQAFYISRESIKLIAKELKKKIRELPKLKPGFKSAWVITDNGFVERSVKTGTTDGASYEIISGLAQQDKIIVDVVETNKLEKIMKKAFKRF